MKNKDFEYDFLFAKKAILKTIHELNINIETKVKLLLTFEKLYETEEKLDENCIILDKEKSPKSRRKLY